MVYLVEITDPCEKRLGKLDKEIQKRFASRIRRLVDNPKQGKPLRGEYHGYWELYFEKSFRILYSIDNENQKIVVEAIKHKDEF